jgi:hypothetical protein
VTLNIGSSIAGGLRRIVNRNGLLLILAYVVLGTVWQVAFYSAIVESLGQSAAPVAATLPSIDLPLTVSVVSALVSLLLLQYLTIVAIRTFVDGHSSAIPSEYYTRNLVFVLVNSILGAIAFGVLVLVGSILLVIPGIVAYVAFIFSMFYVAAEDENFVAALRDSWSLTRGNWIRLFVLLLIVVVGISVVSGTLSALSRFAVGAVGGPALGILVSGVLALPFSILSLAILADAFTQLRAGERNVGQSVS